MDHECLHHRLYNRIDGDGNLGRPFWAKARFLCRDLIVWNHLSVLRPRAKRKKPDCRPISPRSHGGRYAGLSSSRSVSPVPRGRETQQSLRHVGDYLWHRLRFWAYYWWRNRLRLELASEGTAHAAIVHGFGLVMLYGGVGVWFLAVVSFITFRMRKPTPRWDL